MVRYRVLEPYQINNAGKVYGSGQTFEANDDDDMQALVTAEIIERVERAKAKRSRKPSKGKR